MILPDSHLQHVVVEGSSEPDSAGELVIDLEEMYVGEDATNTFHYYQLKHSTVRTHKPTTLSELERTLAGFSQRYLENKKHRCIDKHFYHYISNRPVSASIKNAITQIRAGEKSRQRGVQKMQSITRLTGDDLRKFFSVFEIHDQEEGYLEQETELQFEISRLVAGTVEDGMTHRVLGLISDQALPKSKGGKNRRPLTKVDVLKVFGVSNARDLFPAPAAIEPLKNVFLREQHKDLVKKITESTSRIVVIHAEGGVGKTIVAQQLKGAFPRGSFSLVYDCFGGGTYRSPSQPRHRPRDALMQMANEMGIAGLCSSLIVPDQAAAPEIFKAFKRRLDEASQALRNRNTKALLVLLVDAADNAEMAAHELGEKGFVQLLIREKPPANCRFVFLCRTGRRKLLCPPSTALQVHLDRFSPAETGKHLKARFLKVSGIEAKEFHRLTGGNPRVQSNSMAFAKGAVQDMLLSLGRKKVSVDQQIENQLQEAISHLRALYPEVVSNQIDSICRGLATLPPFIPVPVLAAAACVEPETIISFIADLGRPLWHSDQSVQFRDEPTETWFKNEFAASPDDIRTYVAALEPLAATFTYAARSLPALWHQSNDHDKLITLALSDDFLPEQNAIEAHEVRVYRLQFALKTALKAKRMADAAKLALRAGEEMAGNQRQLDLLENNTDLMAALQDAQLVQECAYKRQLRGAWKGSEEVFAASLLAWNNDFQGEASNCLRTALLWLQNYFQERKQLPKQERHLDDKLERTEIAELAWASLGLHGPQSFCDFISRWRPAELIHEVTSIVVSRLVDAGKFDVINGIARRGSKCTHLILSLSHQLLRVSKLPPKSSLGWTLQQLADDKEKIDETPWKLNQEPLLASVVSFSEACAYHKLSRNKICKLLEGKAVLVPPPYQIASDYDPAPRQVFTKAVALHSVLKEKRLPEIEALVPEPSTAEKEHEENRRIRKDARSILQTLLPLYELRAKLLVRQSGWEDLSILHAIKIVPSPSHDYYGGSRSRIDAFWDEVPVEKLRVLSLQSCVSVEHKKAILETIGGNTSPWRSMASRLEMMRIAYRHEILSDIGHATELACQEFAKQMDSPEPNQRSHWFVCLARAILSFSKSDAAAYFVNAVEETSKFDDEVAARWESLRMMSRAAGELQIHEVALAYRFIRCAELVGKSIDDEKHWNRNNVIRTLSYLHPASAFTGLSRWIERDLGRKDELTESLFEEMALSGGLAPAACFAATGFIGPHGSIKLLELCIKREPLKIRQQKYLNQTVKDVFRQGLLLQNQDQLKTTAGDFALDLGYLDDCLERAVRMQTPAQCKPPTMSMEKSSWDQPKQEDIQNALSECDLTTSKGLSKAIRIACEPVKMGGQNISWSELVSVIPRGREAAFMAAVLSESQVDYFDMRLLTGAIKQQWMQRPAALREWPSFLQKTGQKLSCSLSESHGLSYWMKECALTEAELRHVIKGVLQQIEASSELLDSAALFGFASLAVKDLPHVQVREVLSYALERFELHLPPDFGDGVWSAWLNPPDNVLDAYTGFIWASLGNPDSETRWEASHCVRRLVELDCQQALTSLLCWLGKPGIAAFLGKDFVFYELHARLHMLIGLARGALEYPEVLRLHVHPLIALANSDPPHALIQVEAANLVQRVAIACPEAVSKSEIQALRAIGSSPYPCRQAGDQEVFQSPWHREGLKNWPEHPRFDMDFDTYWISPLCDVFGIPLSELGDLMRETAREVLGAPTIEQYPEDARRAVWNSRSSGFGDYGQRSYPKIHNFSFYYSYHSMMIVAARLLARMPVIERAGWDENSKRWADWLRRRQMVKEDGRWLSDRRDPTLPPRKRKKSDHSSNWLFEVQADDFYDVLTAQAGILGGLCVDGYWDDAESYRCEHVSISCAFVLPEMADSLANATRTAKDIHFCSVRGILNTIDHSEHDSIFEMLPIINLERQSKTGLDDFDPHANSLNLQQDSINPVLIKLLDLKHDVEERFWQMPGLQEPVLAVETWSDGAESHHERYIRSGHRIFASLDFLQLACSRLDRALVIDVEIKRSMQRHSYDENGFSNLPSSKKVFILNSNGSLRDTTTHYQLGKTTC